MEIKSTIQYKGLAPESVFAMLHASDAGLSSDEAAQRLRTFGANEIVEKKANPFLDFIRRFWGPMPWLLELAIILSFVLGHDFEGIIIFLLLTVNAVIGGMHSRSSQKAIELLKQKLAVRAKLLRNGQWKIDDAKDIVPGDVFTVKLGDIIPADALVIDGEIAVDESALTGESLPLEARRSSVVYSGSVTMQGEAKCVAVNTGANTYFGRTAELVKIAKPKSHQEEIMMAIVKYMMYVGIAALVAVLIFGFAIGLHEHIFTLLSLSVTFLMGAVPVALPAVLTIVQAFGAKELAGKGALVTKLDAIEDAASIDVLCLDKTGTITENKLSVSDNVAPAPGFTEQDVITLAALASRGENMDAIDLAMIARATNAGSDLNKYKQLSYTPFDPSTRRTEAVIESDGKRFKVAKGAAQTIIPLCAGVDDATKKRAEDTIVEFSRKGFRTIAVARAQNADGAAFAFAGLLPLADPPRADSKTMIEQAKRAGITPIMLTGDNITIATEIAREVGIGDRIIRMPELTAMSEEDQKKIVEHCNGLAEIYPEDKYKIIKLLQSRGHMTGMTGDGVNDAPALKQAELGIAVSAATDVAKAAASVVLTKPGIAVIMDAVSVSRQIYQRMLTWVINKITKVIEVVGLLTISFFWLHAITLSMLGMSLLIFANDFTTMSLATDHVRHTTKPNKWNVATLTLGSLVPSLLWILEGVAVIWLGMNYFHLAWENLRTLVMLNFVFNSQFRVLIVRERGHFWDSLPGKNLLAVNTLTLIAFTIVGAYGIFVPPVPLPQVLLVLGFSAVVSAIIDFPKCYIFKRLGLLEEFAVA